MTYEFEYLMHLVSVSAIGLPFELPKKELCWRRLFDLASEQAVFALAAAAARPVWNTLEVTLRQEVRAHLYSAIMAEETRTKAVWELMSWFQNEDIPFALLKGMGLAALYKTPELREYGDVDIYTGRKFENRALALLQRHGVSITKRNPAQHESAGYHSDIGEIELHAYLFREEDRKLWFGRSEKYTDAIEPFICQTIDEKHRIPVLSVQNNAEFLCLHFIKHFIREGISIRNIVDLGLFLQEYGKEVNFDRLWELLTSLRYDGIIQTVLNICVDYFHMDASRFIGYNEMDSETIHLFMDDTEQGGYLGANERLERSRSAKAYEGVAFSGSEVAKCSKKWKKRRIFWERVYAAMPNRNELRRKYKYVRNCDWLLPIAWANHLITGSLRVVRATVSKANVKNERSSNERVTLFRRLGIM